MRLRPDRPNHVWSYDVVADRIYGGGKLRMLTVIDECARECLALRVAMTAIELRLGPARKRAGPF